MEFDFDDVFVVINDKKKQILASQILKHGKIPVVDQGQEFISGYSNSQNYHTNIPSIVFGDHTLSLKYIDFNFIVGADGVQILKNKTDKFDLKFLYYLLERKISEISVVQYTRHFKFIKEMTFEIPESLEEQKRVSKILCNVDKNIETVIKEMSILNNLKMGFIDEHIIKMCSAENKISDYFELNPKTEDPKTKISFVQMEDVFNGGGFDTEKNIDSTTKGYTRFKNQDVVIAKVTPCFENGKIFIAKNLFSGYGLGSTEFFVLRSNNENDKLNRLLYYYMQSQYFKKQGIASLRGTGGLKRISSEIFETCEFIDANKYDFSKIGILDSIEKMILNKNEELEKLKILKKGLLKQLL